MKNKQHHACPLNNLDVLLGSRLRKSLIFSVLVLAYTLVIPGTLFASVPAGMQYIQENVERHAGQTGVYVLEKGEESLLARAWLADNAKHTIDVQYFIWSTDNIGILAAESLLRAAERGVQVRVIVDDILIDAPDDSLLALAKHPNVEIRIYNPKHKVGTPLHKRVINLLADFRGFNQRMHDKTFMVDGIVGITGGRNMADEYFDYNHEYNFRDRDVLLLGTAVTQMSSSFERFWQHRLSVPVEDLYDGIGIMQKNVSVNSQEIKKIYRDLHAYAADPANYELSVREAIGNIPETFPEIQKSLVWTQVEFISDVPGKNGKWFSLRGGGRTTTRLADLIKTAEKEVIIQSPYLVLTDEAKRLFEQLINRGVRIRISTNSLASTDNLQAFSGYRSQRTQLLDMGIEIYEYKAHPAIQDAIMQRYAIVKANAPIFAVHAKSMVIDGKVVYVGTFNLDPRSVNLNTEVGAIVRNKTIAKEVALAIERDMARENSWQAGIDNPDKYNSRWKRIKTLFWQMMPIEPLL